MGLQRARCSSSSFLLSFPPPFFLYISIQTSNLHLFFVIRPVSAPLCPIWPYIRAITHWYITPHPAFQSPSLWPPAKPTQMGGHTHTHIKTKCMWRSTSMPSSLRSKTSIIHPTCRAITHTQKICLNPSLWTLHESKHVSFYFFFNYSYLHFHIV